MSKHFLKKRLPLSIIYYVPLYGVLLALILISNRSYSDAMASSISLSNLNRIAGIGGALLLTYLYLTTHRGKKITLPQPILWYCGYMFIAMLSSMLFSSWKGYSIWKTIEVTSVLVLAIYILKLASIYGSSITISFYNKVLVFYKLILLSLFFGIIVSPSLSIRPPSRYYESFLPYQVFGIYPMVNPNSLGMIAAIILFVSIHRFMSCPQRKKKTIHIFWIVFSALVLIFAQSRTAILAFTVAMTFSLIVSRKLNIKTTVFVISSVSYFIFRSIDKIVLYLARGQSEAQFSGMSGRADWWQYAYTQFLNHDIINNYFGLGYMTANRTILAKMGHGGAGSLHSDYIDALISTGYIGLSLLVFSIGAFLFLNLKNSLKHKDGYFLEFAGIAIMLSIRSITGTTFAIFNFFLPLFIIISICIANTDCNHNVVKKE